MPYKVIAKDDEEVYGYSKNTARQRAESATVLNILSHEWLIAKHDENFQYKKIFPELLEKLKEEEQR